MARQPKKAGRSTSIHPPAWIEPQLTRLVDEAPDGPGWLHEIKYDGDRMPPRSTPRVRRAPQPARGGMHIATCSTRIPGASMLPPWRKGGASPRRCSARPPGRAHLRRPRRDAGALAVTVGIGGRGGRPQRAGAARLATRRRLAWPQRKYRRDWRYRRASNGQMLSCDRQSRFSTTEKAR
jgi:hypothetical protein